MTVVLFAEALKNVNSRLVLSAEVVAKPALL
jgi:hypothetical protein